MLLQNIRRLSEEEDGQALVLAALLMLIIALAVLSISHLGQSVHERIQLQNAADNAAYSLAAEEARAFNFYAYTNRAQIAQYVTILQVLSVDSMLLGVMVGLGALASLMKTAASACGSYKKYLCGMIPVIGKILLAITAIASVVEKVARVAAQAIKALDTFVGMVVVPLLVAANLFLFATQAAFFAATLARLRGEEVLRIARRTSPQAELAFGETTHTAANALRFAGAHFRESMSLFGTSDPQGAKLDDGSAGRQNYARRGMGELIHASRHGAVVYDRTFPGGLAASQSEVPGMSEVNYLLDLLKVARFKGHTRLHSDANIQPTVSSMKRFYQQMEKPGYSTARYPTGNSIGANFYLEFGGVLANIADGLGFNRKELASVTSTGGRTKGWVCSWDPSRPYKKLPLGLVTLHAPRFSCDMQKGKHPWWGITPYMAFDATAAGCDSFEAEHCQPDVWVALRIPKDEDQGSGVEVATPSGPARATAMWAGSGPMAVSRGLAYYHRAGSWKEPPNFFNPHWRAKLAPVEPGLSRAAADLPAGLGVAYPAGVDGILTH